LYVPYDFAYEPNDSVTLDIAETLIDVLFMVDIVVSFRTMYVSEATGDLIDDPKRIATNYVFRGRFFIDLLSSIPVDLLILAIQTDSKLFSIIKILKLSRLFRLGRIVSILKFRTSLKSGLKMILIVAFLLL
jgi:hypothetical protein